MAARGDPDAAGPQGGRYLGLARLAVCALLTASAARPARGVQANAPRLDHVPVAVSNLDSVVAIWRDRLGFSLKPGRLHPNSIENAHVKFIDGTSLELITATKPVDDQARGYIERIRKGNGPAYLALRPPSMRRAVEAVRAAGFRFDTVTGPYYEWLTFPQASPLGWLFFSTITNPPIDRPEHLRHRNSALGLVAVWLRKTSFVEEEALLTGLGVTLQPVPWPGRDGMTVDEARLGEGRLYLIRGDPAADDSRPIVRLTVAVADLDAAIAALRDVGAPPVGRDARGRSILLPAAGTGGTDVELLEMSERTRDSGSAR